MSFDKIFDLAAGVYFYFYNIYDEGFFFCGPSSVGREKHVPHNHTPLSITRSSTYHTVYYTKEGFSKLRQHTCIFSYF